MRPLILGFVLTVAAGAALADDSTGGPPASREELAIQWALSYRPVDAGVASLVDEALAASDPATREALLLRIGEPARRVVMQRAVAVPKEQAAGLLAILARMQPIEDEVERRGLSHDLGYLLAAGAPGAARARSLVATDADPLRWQSERAGSLRFDPVRDRFVPREAWGADQAPLRFRGQDRVRLEKTAGMFVAGSSFTFECWARFERTSKKWSYLAGDEAWPGMNDSVFAPAKQGFVFRRHPRNDGTELLEFTCAVEPDEWFTVMSPPLRATHDWEHLAFTSEPAGIRIYRDGECVAASAFPKRALRGTTDVFLGAREGASKDRNSDFDLRAVRMSEGVLYRADFVPAQRLGKDGGPLVLLDFTPGAASMRDLTGHGHDGTVAGAEWVPAISGNDVRRLLAPVTGADGEFTIFEAESGGRSDDWTVADRNHFSSGVNVEVWSTDAPKGDGLWVSVPLRVEKAGRYRLHMIGAGLHRLSDPAAVSPFSWWIDAAAPRVVASALPAVYGLRGNPDTDISPLGVVDLAAGEHMFRLRLLRPRAKHDAKWSLWVDALALERVD